MSDEFPPRERSAYFHFLEIPSRWMDNDVYGHINNAVYYSYVDTVVNRYLIDEGGLDYEGGDVIGLVVESRCRYFEPLAYPQVVSAGLRVARLGNSSVVYEVGLFTGTSTLAAAVARFVHVFVDRTTRRPHSLGAQMREALSRIVVPES